MKFTIFLFFLFGHVYALEYDLSLLGGSYEFYQDIIINGKLVKVGYGPHCEPRYQAIKKHVFSKYQRSFSVLEIGANSGYFGFRALAEFPCHYIMVDGYKGLPYICQWNTTVHDRAIVLNQVITEDELLSLSETEHFDVIIMCNLLHHLGDAYQKWIDAALNMCSHLIIEIPAPNDPISGSKNIGAVTHSISSLPNVKIIAYTPRNKSKLHLPFSPMFWIDNSSKVIRQANRTISSDWISKTITRRIDNQSITKEWVQGMSLANFFRLSGAFPLLDLVEFQDIEHQIIQGFEIQNL